MDTSAGSECEQKLNEVIKRPDAQTGSTKPLYRFLRGEPKGVGIVLLSLGVCLFMFGIPLRLHGWHNSATDIYAPFWLGILYFICGVLYIQAELHTTKKIVTASFAFSIISILGTILSAIVFTLDIATYYEHRGYSREDLSLTALFYGLESVFLFHSLVAGVFLIIMTVFSRYSLRSTHTQMSVVMRYPASEE